MASATGIPAHPTAVDPRERGLGEDEPLLGRPGDASQQEGWPLWFNLGLGILPSSSLMSITSNLVKAPQSSLKSLSSSSSFMYGQPSSSSL